MDRQVSFLTFSAYPWVVSIAQNLTGTQAASNPFPKSEVDTDGAEDWRLTRNLSNRLVNIP